jgi:hypothetical protein
LGRAKKSDPAAAGILQQVLTPARAQDVLDHREMIGAPMTRRAAELLIGKLAEAPDPNAAADMMISRGWRGFDVGWIKDQSREYGRRMTASEITGENLRREIAELQGQSGQESSDLLSTGRLLAVSRQTH